MQPVELAADARPLQVVMQGLEPRRRVAAHRVEMGLRRRVQDREGVQGGEAFFGPLTVSVRDWTGKPIVKTPVVFSVGTKPSAMACQLDPGGNAQVTLVTDDKGMATLRQMSNSTGDYSARIYYTDGQCQIIATSNGGLVTFHLNAKP